jgi:iron complex transport system substrate-binding protein
VEIASEPKRVVALSPQDADISTALGVVPVAAVEYFNSKTALSPWLAPKVGSKKIDILPDPSSQGSVSFEKLAALTPDLILAGNLFTLERDYDKLVRIAPVVAFQEGPLEDGWQEKTQLAGRALGREQQAREVVTKLEGRFDELRRDHPEFANKTFSFSVQLAPGGVETITSTKDYAVQLMTQLGLRLTPTVASLKNATETSSEGNVSLEELRVLDADVMVMAFATDGLRKQLERSRVFQRIPAVRRGDYVPLTLDAIAALRGPSVLSIPYGLDALVPGLTRSLDG